MSAFGNAIGALFKRHKLKAFSIFAFAAAFAFLIFPYGDLADLLTRKVSEATGGAVFLDVDAMSLSFWPPGAELDRVTLETPSMPAISLASLAVSPSVSSLLALRLGGSLAARGLFKGDVEASYAQGKKTKSGERVHVVDASLSGVNLSGVNDFLRSMAAAPGAFGGDPMAAMQGQLLGSLNLKGSASGTMSASVDPRFDEPPTGAFNLDLKNFSANLTSLLGMDLIFERAAVVGRLSEGKLKVEKADLGSAKDEISLKAKGSMDLAFVAAGGGSARPIPGAYDFNVTLRASDAATRRLGLILDSIVAQGAKVEKSAGSSTYKFRALSGGAGGLPRYLPGE